MEPTTGAATVRRGAGPAGVAVAAVAGEIDTISCRGLDQELQRILCRPDTEAVVIDLEGVSYLGTAGIHTLVHASETAAAFAKPFRVVACTRVASRPIELCGVTEPLGMCSCLQDAFRGLLGESAPAGAVGR